jgi:hypothetical protein
MGDLKPAGRNVVAGMLAVSLLGVFILINYILSRRDAHQTVDPLSVNERESLPSNLEGAGKQIALYDFEAGNAMDTAQHLATKGHDGKQSLRLSQKVPFSPGLWIRFSELKPGDSTWIRATGYVWFSCPVSEARCSLVATCNHNGVNYKYMSIPVELSEVKRGQWNRISIDYRVPPAVDPGDVVQAYFWYRGIGEMLVDDISVAVFTQ